MLYKRYKMLQKYINGEAQEEYKQGELISDVTFGTLSECNEGNQKPDESIEGNIYQWITISGDYVCNGKDKYAKEKEQTSSDGGATWTDTGRTRQGYLLQANSDDCTDFTTFDCGIIFTDLNTNDHHFSTNSGARFELLNTQVNNANGYIRVNFRIHIKKNMNSYDWVVMGNGTIVASRYIGNVVNGQVITDYFEVPCGNYNFMLMIQEVIGDTTLKYAQSRVTYICNDCSEHTVEYRWVVVDGHYVCVGHNKYEQLKKQESIDGGEWTDVLPLKTMKGNLIEANSTDCGYVPPTPGDYENQYLTFDIVTPGTIVWKTTNRQNVKKISYSINNGEWSKITSSTSGASFNVSVGDKVRFKGNNTAYGVDDFSYNTFDGSTASFNVQGNIMSLINGDSFANATTFKSNYVFVSLFNNTKVVNAKNLILPVTTLTNYCYYSMFQGCTSLTTAPILPATTLANNCYEYMFRETNLTTAPELPATTLAQYCYSSMFYGCTSLETAPELPATTLANNCYSSMFYGCTNLVNAPELPVTTLARECYYAMFQDCTSLVTAPTLPAITLANSCYNNMFEGCTKLNYIKAMFVTKPGADYTYNWVRGVASSGIFVKNSEATWNFTGNDGIPTGWTVIKE